MCLVSQHASGHSRCTAAKPGDTRCVHLVSLRCQNPLKGSPQRRPCLQGSAEVWPRRTHALPERNQGLSLRDPPPYLCPYVSLSSAPCEEPRSKVGNWDGTFLSTSTADNGT
uniref:Uncharacterized protein n=1 Tax=Knipowitschia caucasica TaxID=637954 RepID=A0AAV2LWU6_KNICA